MAKNDFRLFPLSKREDLQFDYPNSPKGDDDPKKRTAPSPENLNREDWYEVMYFCNYQATFFGAKRKDYALDIERYLKYRVPSELKEWGKITGFLQPFLMSNTQRKALVDNLLRIENNTFMPRDIKELLIDLREPANQFLAMFDNPIMRPITKQLEIKSLKSFVEVANFIAHTKRNKGLSEEYIRRNITKFRERKNPAESIHDVGSAVFIHEAIIGLYTVLAFLTNQLGNHTLTAKVVERQNEIALCILVLVQGSYIHLQDSRGEAFLVIHPYNGQYRIYCLVPGMPNQIQDQKDANNPGESDTKNPIGFPVIYSEIPCRDPELFGSDIKIQEVELYRGHDKLFHCRILEDF